MNCFIITIMHTYLIPVLLYNFDYDSGKVQKYRFYLLVSERDRITSMVHYYVFGIVNYMK